MCTPQMLCCHGRASLARASGCLQRAQCRCTGVLAVGAAARPGCCQATCSTAAAVAVMRPAHQQRAAGEAWSQSWQCFTTRTGGCRTQVTAANGCLAQAHMSRRARLCCGGRGTQDDTVAAASCSAVLPASWCTNKQQRPQHMPPILPASTAPCCRHGVARPSLAKRSLFSAQQHRSPSSLVQMVRGSVTATTAGGSNAERQVH